MIDVPTRVKDALRENNLLKNYRFNVLNDDGTVDFTIDNDNLKSEKVCFDERLASGEVLKFGLCEGTSLEFQYFGLPDINGRRIQAFIDVQYKDAEGQKQWYTIPMGFYTVKKCPMQFSTGIRKVTAYNKLMSDYLDSKANDLIKNAYDDLISEPYISGVSLDLILREVLGGYAIDNTEKIPYTLSSYIVSTSGTRYRDPYSIYTPPMALYSFMVISHIMDIEVTDTSMLDSNKTITGYTSLKITGINAIKNYMLDRMDSELFEDGSFYLQIQNANGTYTQSLDNVGDELTTPIFENVVDVDILEGTAQTAQTLVGRSHIRLCIPAYSRSTSRPNEIPSYADEQQAESILSTLINDLLESGDMTIEIIHQVTGGVGEKTVDSSIETWNDVTLRDLQSAVFETRCQFGKLDRQTDLFSGVELNNPTLYPQDSLYPEDTLYPSGTKERTIKSSYSQLWTDDGGEQSFKYLIITYQGLDENNQKVDFTLQRTINTHGTTNYNLSDNWLFKNLIWTAEQIGAYADAMVEKMRDIRWFPFEMWASGLPYIETGDEFEIVDRQGQTHTSYVLKRTLEGIQNLQDTYENGIVDVF